MDLVTQPACFWEGATCADDLHCGICPIGGHATYHLDDVPFVSTSREFPKALVAFWVIASMGEHEKRRNPGVESV